VILKFLQQKKMPLKILLSKPDQKQVFLGAGQRGIEPSKIVFIGAFGQVRLLDKNIFPLATL
jgi:hypothetical protein